MSDPIKDAFSKVKEDISSLKEQLYTISKELFSLKSTILDIKNQTDNQTDRQTNTSTNQTNTNKTQTNKELRQENRALEGIKTPNFDISTGNEGVQTDRQTIRQTDRQIERFVQYSKPIEEANYSPPSTISTEDRISHIKNVSEILDSLDELKKDLRFKFKKLTSQEMSLFSLIYDLEERGFTVDYSLLSSKLSITQSAVRDHIRNILSKGIPLKKLKENNKKVFLSIPLELKKVASLQTILSLRNI